jgi:hypothetical protein
MPTRTTPASDFVFWTLALRLPDYQESSAPLFVADEYCVFAESFSQAGGKKTIFCFWVFEHVYLRRSYMKLLCKGAHPKTKAITAAPSRA